MPRPKTAYELNHSQVSTPPEVVELFWRLTNKRRAKLDTVLDLGADDCRFARGGTFRKYVGVEIDPKRVKKATPPKNGTIISGCAFKHSGENYQACIGNPPYVRHHDIESPWKENTLSRLEEKLELRLNRKCNLFIYFLCLALLKTREDGIVAQIIPYEWVSRPSSKAIRELIRQQRWEVDVYRFQTRIFPGVLTTASITIIDKRATSGRWSFFDVDDKARIHRRAGAVEHGHGVLEYAERGSLWAMRGLSPGSQQVFCLTEGERIHHGLRQSDVFPCVTTLRHVPRGVRLLNRTVFKRLFVDSGERCWLIKSCLQRRSVSLNSYLAGVPGRLRDNYTCNARESWFSYKPHPVANLLVASGFTHYGPKVLINSVGAHAVGAVTGVYTRGKVSASAVQRFLLNVDFESRVVAHAKTLKKVEVRQLNAVLNTFAKTHGKHLS